MDFSVILTNDAKDNYLWSKLRGVGGVWKNFRRVVENVGYRADF